MKYSLTKNKIEVCGKTLFQIKAEISFGSVSKGDLGGYIEKEENLSQENNAWVYGNARVYGNAEVYGNARVYGDAWVSGNARVYGNAMVYGKIKLEFGWVQACVGLELRYFQKIWLLFFLSILMLYIDTRKTKSISVANMG